MHTVWPGALLAVCFLAACAPSPQQALLDIENAADPEQRIVAMEVLLSGADPALHAAVAARLRDSDAAVVSAAQSGLAAITAGASRQAVVEEMLRLHVPVERARLVLTAYGDSARDVIIEQPIPPAGPGAAVIDYLLMFRDQAVAGYLADALEAATNPLAIEASSEALVAMPEAAAEELASRLERLAGADSRDPDSSERAGRAALVLYRIDPAAHEALVGATLIRNGSPRQSPALPRELAERLGHRLAAEIQAQLKDTDTGVRLRGVSLASEFSISAAAPALRTLLSPEGVGEEEDCIESRSHAELRAAAAHALARLDDREAIPALIDAFIRTYNQESCARFWKDQAYLDRLRGVQPDEPPPGGDYDWLRRQFLEALLAFGEDGLVAAAAEIPNGWAVCELVEKGSLGPNALVAALDTGPGGDVAECLIGAMAKHDDPPVTDRLLELLFEETAFPDEGTDYSRSAAAAMAALQPRVATISQRLMAMVRVGPPQAAARALRLLAGGVGGPETAALLLQGLDAPQAIVRAAAAEGVGAGEYAAAIEPLSRLVSAETDQTVLWAAMESLARLDAGHAAGILVRRLQSESDPDLKRALVFQLQEMSHPAAIGALVDVLGDFEPERIWTAHSVENAAAEALAAIGEPALGAVTQSVQAGSGAQRRGALRALLELDPTASAALRLLEEIPTAPGEAQRRAAIGALAGMDRPEARDYFLAALDAKDLEAVAAGHAHYLKHGYEASELTLIEALNAHGNREMAERYLNQSNQTLQRAAADWASKHGYSIGFER